MGNVVVMGRRSFEEIGRPLPNRTTIVISNTKEFTGDNCYTVGSLQEAIKLAGNRDVFISGGARLYEEALPIVEKMYTTEIDKTIDGDTYFPNLQMRILLRKSIKELKVKFHIHI